MNKTITIDKNDYLQGLENFLIPKEFFNEIIKEQLDLGSLYFAFIFGWISFYFGKKTLRNSQNEKILWTLLTLIPTTFFGRLSLNHIICLLKIHKNYKTTEIETFKDQAYIIGSRKNIIYCSPKQLKYEIKPGDEFEDLFFINHKTWSENVWDQAKIKLKYHKDFDDKSKFSRELDSQQQAVLTIFKKRKIITSKDIQTFFSLSPRSASGLCLKWLENGFLILNDPAKKSRKYELNPEINKNLFE